MKRLMPVDEAKEVCRDRRVWRSVLSDYPAKDKVKLVVVVVVGNVGRYNI